MERGRRAMEGKKVIREREREREWRVAVAQLTLQQPERKAIATGITSMCVAVAAARQDPEPGGRFRESSWARHQGHGAEGGEQSAQDKRTSRSSLPVKKWKRKWKRRGKAARELRVSCFCCCCYSWVRKNPVPGSRLQVQGSRHSKWVPSARVSEASEKL